MRDKLQLVASLLLTLLLSFGVQAKEYEGKSSKPVKPIKPSTEDMAKMMECLPPVSYTEFSLNNVRFGLEAGGQIWEDNGDASYEIPKIEPGSNEASIHSLYAGALWIGGYSPDGNLKLAAVTYRSGGATDFYNGPLSTNGFATSDYCNQVGYNEFDEHFYANRTDVQIHRAYYECEADPDCVLEDLFPNGYSMPDYFEDWPGYNEDPNYSSYLAPYWDSNADGFYDPSEGDYPWYDLDNAIDCRTRAVTDPIPLFGDETLWWVFNDNGGIHTETDGDPIGMEIQAQAFAYTTTDEINNMTFYNYVLINRGQQTLQNCYFGQWVDPDLGCPTDDFVGCDVQRGLSYTINGIENDAACGGVPGYDLLPPAVGIDFFEGPFQDADGINNPLTTDLQQVNDFDGIPYEGIGIGYQDLSLELDDPALDLVVDNERFGMRRFVYYNRDDQTATPNINGEPNIAIEFYSYLDGIWKNGEPMTYGGNGVGGTIPTDYMFPGLTDPVGFATNGAITNDDWTEGGETNEPGDRRFIQSAGTFVLDPGEFNNITVGVVWARPFGNTETTLNALRVADDKAQSLFDNCFRILSGPDSPDLTAQELSNKVILYIENENPTSNNYQESYGFPSPFAFDPLIPGIDPDGQDIPAEDRYYEFQGYKIYQLKDETVSAAELTDPDRARLVFQTDIQDNVGQLINYVSDPTIGLLVPTEAVNGSNQGLQHSVQLDQDAFATGANNLVNFKKYYYMCVAYAYNEYFPYNPATLGGQALPYIESRKSATGEIPVITVIPHDPTFENGGTIANSEFGDVVALTRLEGEGNGANVVDISAETRDRIAESPYGVVSTLEYEAGGSPVNVKIIDPLRVSKADFEFGLQVINDQDPDDVLDDFEIDEPENIGWFLVDLAYPNDTIFSQNSIDLGGEQLILSHTKSNGDRVNYGLSIDFEQYEYGVIPDLNNEIPEFLESTVVYDDPAADAWYSGVSDGDGNNEQNWIRAGSNTVTSDPTPIDDPNGQSYYLDKNGIDPSETFENVLDGTISPWHLAAQSWYGPAYSEEDYQVPSSTRITDLNNVDVRFTSNKDHWTRAAVLEIEQFQGMAQGGAEKLHARVALSLDKDGKNQLNGGDYDECTMNGTQVMTQEALDELSNGQIDDYIAAAWPGEAGHTADELLGLSFGMSWFPGYAVDVESGERLNMAFGERSSLGAENGNDMLWNPTSNLLNGQFPFPNTENARFGGFHYWYVFRNQSREQLSNPTIRMPQYDNSNFIYKNINLGSERKRIFRACTWVGLPLLAEGAELLSVEDGLIPADMTVRIRVAKPYERLPVVEDFYLDYLNEDEEFPYFYWDDESGIFDPSDLDADDMVTNPTVPAYDYSANDWLPYYAFSTDAYSTEVMESAALTQAFETGAINVVPNPYYGRAEFYENGRLNTEVKIINIPSHNRTVVRIYDVSGTLVRTLEKDPSGSADGGLTEIIWDLKNERNVPVASGVHIFHVDVEGVGERVIKWFGVMRPVDLDNF